MDVHEYLGVLRRGIVLIVLWVLLGILGGAAVQSTGSPGYAIVGGVLGLAVGLLAASLREALDTRVRSPKDIAAIARIPILGRIPADRAVWSAPLVARNIADAPIAESFRALRAAVDHLRTRDGRQSFVITAGGPGQGSTTITGNLAVALANTATSVVVVDADLRSSALSRMFGFHGVPGLTEVLAGRASLDAALQSSDGGRLTVLPAGARPSNPGELLATPAMRELVAELRRRFAVVLIDAPAISAVTDAVVLGSIDSATLLVLAEGTTTRSSLEEALSLLASGGSVPVGIVLTAIPRRRLFGRGPARRRDHSDSVEVPVFVTSAAPKESAPPANPTPVASPTPPKAPAASTTRAPAALPTATADEQRAGSIAPEIETSRPPVVERPVERPIVVRPDPPKPASRFAPDPSKLTPEGESAYASAPAPALGTVVNTVSIRVGKQAKEAATVPPPIRNILPVSSSPTTQKVLEATSKPDVGDTAASPRPPVSEREPEPVELSGSLLSEIGGLPRVEVRAARQVSLTDSGPNPERQARESYELRARELERAAHDRLMREQQRLAVSIREQLAHDKRELESVLDNRLEDTVLRPIGGPQRKAADSRLRDSRDDEGETR